MNSFPTIAGIQITTDEQGRFNLNALHRASGLGKSKGPAYWLALDGTKALINQIQMTDTEIPVSVLRGGAEQGTFAHELLAISYAGWISPAFQLQVNQTFIDFKTGKLNPMPTQLSRMDILTMAMEAEEERQRLEHKVQEDAPKVAFHDQVTVLEGTMSVAQAAQTLGTGQQRLFQFLRKAGWVIGHQKNRPYQHIVQAGWMDLKLGRITKPNGTIQEIVTPLITAKGLARLQKIYAEEVAA